MSLMRTGTGAIVPGLAGVLLSRDRRGPILSQISLAATKPEDMSPAVTVRAGAGPRALAGLAGLELISSTRRGGVSRWLAARRQRRRGLSCRGLSCRGRTRCGLSRRRRTPGRPVRISPGRGPARTILPRERPATGTGIRLAGLPPRIDLLPRRPRPRIGPASLSRVGAPARGARRMRAGRVAGASRRGVTRHRILVVMGAAVASGARGGTRNAGPVTEAMVGTRVLGQAGMAMRTTTGSNI